MNPVTDDPLREELHLLWKHIHKTRTIAEQAASKEHVLDLEHLVEDLRGRVEKLEEAKGA